MSMLSLKLQTLPTKIEKEIEGVIRSSQIIYELNFVSFG